MAKAEVVEKPIEGIPVESATLHQAHMVNGVGTVVQLNQAKVPGIKMWLTPQGLRCTVKNKEFIIPAANCTGFNILK